MGSGICCQKNILGVIRKKNWVMEVVLLEDRGDAIIYLKCKKLFSGKGALDDPDEKLIRVRWFFKNIRYACVIFLIISLVVYLVDI